MARPLAALLIVLSLPSPLLAADATVASADAGTISRGSFIKDAVDTLSLTITEKGTVPYTGVPASLLPAVRTAHARSALSVFGKDLKLTEPITRSQAVQVLVKLLSLPEPKTTQEFSDIRRNTVEARAIQIAIDRQWLKPLRATVFGAKRPLTLRESRLLLSRVKRSASMEEESDSKVEVIRVKIAPRTQRELPNGEILQTIWNLLNDEYLYKDKIKADEASFRAAEGLVQSLGDPYTTFMRPASARNFQTQIQGEVTGIGAQVEQKGTVLIIVSPLPSSPAEKAGLKPGDEIIAADDKSLAGLSFEDAVSRVRGPKGTSVKLRIRREGAEFDVEVLRDLVRVPEIIIKFQGNVAVVKIVQFGQTTDRDLRGLMEEVAKQKPSGIILDLRNNPGGLLHAADVVASNFLPEGSTVAKIVAKGETREEVTTGAPTIDPSMPLVVLVNRGSASASEIVAGALQDAKRAVLVGQKSFGKGTVQQVLQFNDGSTLKMTVAEWLTPAGRKIDGVGVMPDHLVEEGERDEPMLKALELLR
ncbi:MAG: S41 family peptidase [Candidatus Peregrinibacteria bacterium]|nr:S41 family peptidase [Candidatus Peregrinibacteria bacterium]